MTRQIGLCRAFEEAAARTPPHTEQRFWAGLREKPGSIFVQDKGTTSCADVVPDTATRSAGRVSRVSGD